jgi:hypothetical protein
MNAPAPPLIETAGHETSVANRCPGTQLTVPECSCQACVTRLLHAYAPALLASESA